MRIRSLLGLAVGFSALIWAAIAIPALAQTNCPGVNCTLNTVLTTPLDGLVSTYSVTSGGFTAASSPTDVFQICGSSTKTIKITRVAVSGRATSAAVTGWALHRRSTATTAGTSTTETVATYDTNQPAASAAVLAFTANPTPGTFVSTLASGQYFLGTLTSTASQTTLEVFENRRPIKDITLRGAAQCVVFNLLSTTNSGNVWDIVVEWTEQ